MNDRGHYGKTEQDPSKAGWGATAAIAALALTTLLLLPTVGPKRLRKV